MVTSGEIILRLSSNDSILNKSSLMDEFAISWSIFFNCLNITQFDEWHLLYIVRLRAARCLPFKTLKQANRFSSG